MNGEKSMENLLYALMGPRVYPSVAGWKETPGVLAGDIVLQRLINASKDVKEATDAEVLTYLMNASLNGPLSYQDTKIYSWLFAKRCKENGQESPVSFEELDEYELSLLKELRGKIYRKSRQAFHQRIKRGIEND